MEEQIPLDKIYSQEKMKAFINENLDIIINSELNTDRLPRFVAGKVARERKKSLIRQKTKTNLNK